MELDVRGSVCPGPTGDTLAALKELPAGGKLVVITDYLLARQTKLKVSAGLRPVDSPPRSRGRRGLSCRSPAGGVGGRRLGPGER